MIQQIFYKNNLGVDKSLANRKKRRETRRVITNVMILLHQISMKHMSKIEYEKLGESYHVEDDNIHIVRTQDVEPILKENHGNA